MNREQTARLSAGLAALADQVNAAVSEERDQEWQRENNERAERDRRLVERQLAALESLARSFDQIAEAALSLRLNGLQVHK